MLNEINQWLVLMDGLYLSLLCFRGACGVIILQHPLHARFAALNEKIKSEHYKASIVCAHVCVVCGCVFVFQTIKRNAHTPSLCCR